MRMLTLTLALVTALASCAETGSEPAAGPAVPTRIELGFTGQVAPIVNSDGMGEIAVMRDGADEPVIIAFRNGATADIALAPGAYRLTSVGALACDGLHFNVASGAGAKALGTLRGEVIETDYYVAMLAGRPATAEQVQDLAAAHEIEPASIDAAPMLQTRVAPCYVHTQGPGQTWQELPLGEKILLGIGFAGFCAIALASGEFCAF